MKKVHKNSVKSHRELKKGGKHNRILQVFHICNRSLTDREVKIIGKFDDMNDVRPRITELLSEDYGRRLEYVDDVICIKTNKEVRRTRLTLQRELF